VPLARHRGRLRPLSRGAEPPRTPTLGAWAMRSPSLRWAGTYGGVWRAGRCPGPCRSLRFAFGLLSILGLASLRLTSPCGWARFASPYFALRLGSLRLASPYFAFGLASLCFWARFALRLGLLRFAVVSSAVGDTQVMGVWERSGGVQVEDAGVHDRALVQGGA